MVTEEVEVIKQALGGHLDILEDKQEKVLDMGSELRVDCSLLEKP